MARIPQAEEVGRVIRDRTAPVATVNVGNVGQGLQRLAVAVDTTRDAKVRYQYSQAASEFLVRKAQQDSAYDNDQDYTTIEQRYNENVGKALEESAALIQDGAVRNEFMMQHRVSAAEGTARIQGLARNRERDYQRGYLAQQLQAVADTGAVGDPTEALDTMQAMIITGRDMGYYSAEEAANQIAQSRRELAVRNIESRSPREQLEVLSQDWVRTNLPADVLTRLDRNARDAVRLDTAVTAADTEFAAVANGSLSLADAQERLAKNLAGDPETMRLAQDRLFLQQNRFEETNRTEQLGLQKKYDGMVRSGQMTIFDIPAEDYQRMDPNTRNALQAVQPSANGTRTVSDRATVHDLNLLQVMVTNNQQPPPALLESMGLDPQLTARQALYARFQSGSGNLSESDFGTWSEVAAKGIVPPEFESEFTAQQRLTAVMDDLMDLRVEGQRPVQLYSQERTRFDNWRKQVQEKTGYPPNDSEMQTYLDQMVIRTITGDKPGLFTGDWTWTELPEPQKLTEIQRLRQSDPELAARVDAAVGVNASPDRWRAQYELEAD